MIDMTRLTRIVDTTSAAEETLARMGTLAVVAASLAVLLGLLVV